MRVSFTRFPISVVTAVAAAALSSCGDTAPTATDLGPAAGAGSMDAAVPADSGGTDADLPDALGRDAGQPDADEPSAFSQLYENVLAPACGPNCHVTSVEPGRLDLSSAATAFGDLVGEPMRPECDDTRIRVVPFRPEESWIMRVRDDFCGPARHGPANLPQASRLLTDADLAEIEAWIRMGAAR